MSCCNDQDKPVNINALTQTSEPTGIQMGLTTIEVVIKDLEESVDYLSERLTPVCRKHDVANIAEDDMGKPANISEVTTSLLVKARQIKDLQTRISNLTACLDF